MKIIVEIDRLVFDGVALEPGSEGRIGAAVRRELSRLLGGAGNQFSGVALARAAAPQIPLTLRQSSVSIGQSIAASVHSSIARNTTETRS